MQDERRKDYARRVDEEEKRRLRAMREKDRGIWFGLGTFGIVGWSVVVPTAVGTAIGIWIDGRASGGYSWTLTLMLAGLAVGCLNAWYWVGKGRRDIDRRKTGGRGKRKR